MSPKKQCCGFKNINWDPDPEFWPVLDPDPELCYQFRRKQIFKIIFENNNFLQKNLFLKSKKWMVPEEFLVSWVSEWGIFALNLLLLFYPIQCIYWHGSGSPTLVKSIVLDQHLFYADPNIFLYYLHIFIYKNEP